MSNRPCPKCRELGRDKNGDHLWLMRDGKTWACFKEHHAPYMERDNTSVSKSDVNDRGLNLETLEMVEEYPTFDKEYRGIRGEIYKKHGIKYSVSEDRGELEFLFYPVRDCNGEIVGYHRRDIENKQFKNVGNVKGSKLQLFNLHNCTPGKKILVCEGHQDALAAYQMLKDKYPQYEPNVVSTNNGTGDIQSVHNSAEFLKKYQNILLSFDQDKPGEEFLNKVASLLGDKIRVMRLSEKDANEILKKGKDKEFIDAFFNADRFLPTDIITPESIRDEIAKKIEVEISFPYEGLNKFLYGIFLQQLITIGAGVGTGKSVFVDAIIRHLITTYNKMVAVFSLEESPAYTMKKLIGGMIGRPLHYPGVEVSPEELNGALAVIKDKLFLYNSQGYKDTSDIETSIRYLAAMGVQYFFIDPLTAITAELSASEANERLNSFCATLSSLVIQLNISIFLVSHLNNPSSGKAHSEGGRVSGEQLTSSRAAYRWSHVVLGLERNLQAEEEEERNTLAVRIIKNRLIGKTGIIYLRFDPDTYLFKEVQSEF